MRLPSLFIVASLSLVTAACSEDLAPGLEGEDDIDSELVADGEDLKADSLNKTATYYHARRDYRKCAYPMCGGFYVSRVNRQWTKCHDGAWRNACYVVELDLAKKLGLSEDEASGVLGDIETESVVLRGGIKSERYNGARFGKFVPSEAWRAATGGEAGGTFFKVTDNQRVCVTGPCAILHEAKLNSTISRDIHALGFDPTGANELLVNQLWTELDAGPLLVAGKNVEYKDALTGRKGVRLEASQVYSRIVHSDLASYAPTAREIGGRTFTNPSAAAPSFPRTYRFASHTWDVTIEDAVAPCPAGATCIWSGIVTRTATWGVTGDRVFLTFDGGTENDHGIAYFDQLAVKRDASGALVLVEPTGSARQFR